VRTVVAVVGSLGIGLLGIARGGGDGRLEGRLGRGLRPRLAALDRQLARRLDRRLV
jgi:hypothetical protein